MFFNLIPCDPLSHPPSSLQTPPMSDNHRSWSDLPPDLLHTISTRLALFSDHIRLRAVCRHFRLSIPAAPLRLPPQLPWLMLPHSYDRRRCCFYDLVKEKVHFVEVVGISAPRRVCCESHGWLVVFSESPEVFCFNPLTKSKVYLPPLTAFPHVIDFSFNDVGSEYKTERWMGFKLSCDLKHMRDYFVKKVVLSSSPDGRDDWFAVAIMCYTSEMVYCDGKDGESWKLVDARFFSCEEGFFWCEDVIYDKGLFYGVDKRGWIAMLDPRNLVEGAMVQLKAVETPESFGGDVVYLVKLKDDLLMVSRILDAQCKLDGTMFHKTIRFEVYKLDWSLLRWDVVNELGDYALFLGQNSSLSRSASLYGGCRGNRIYFTDDLSENTSNGDWRYHDMGVFNLKNQRIKPLVSYWENSECTPIWVTPNPCMGDTF